MASIKKLPGGPKSKFRARYRDANGKEHARHFDLKKQAQAWLDEVTADVVTGRYVDPRAGNLTFNQWWAKWSARQVWVPGTLRAAGFAARSVTFGDVRMSEIRPSHIEAWVKSMEKPAASRKKGLGPQTIASRFIYVHSAFKAAVRDKIIVEDPAKGARLPRVRKLEHAMSIPTPEEVGKALRAAPEWFAPFIAVCAFAGLRAGEAAGLRLDDVDFLRRRIAVRRQLQGTRLDTLEAVPPKYGSEREVYVPEGLTTILAQHVEAHGTRGEERYLFVSGDGNLHRVDGAGNVWRQVRRAAGLPDAFTLHDLRHFYASGLIADGCDVVTVQRALGHSKASITLDTYSHLWPTAEDKTRKAAQGMISAALAVPADSLRTKGVS